MSESKPPIIEAKKEFPQAAKNTPETPPKGNFFASDDIDLIPVKQYFDIDAADSSQDKYVRSILEWAKKKGLSDRSDLNTELKKMELKLGAPELGERRTVRLARYLELDARLSGTLREMMTLDRRA